MNDYHVIRNGAGVVDLSDWGRFALRGTGAPDALDILVGANMLGLYDGAAVHTLIVSESGGVEAVVWVVGLVDGLMVVCEPEDIAAVGALLTEVVQSHGATVEDLRQSRFALTLAGPTAQAVAEHALGDDVHSIAFLGALEIGAPALLAARLGLVGEYELHLFGAIADKDSVIDALTAAGAQHLESTAYPAMMVEMRTLSRCRDIPADISVFESGLQWMVDFRKDNLRGRQALEERRSQIRHKYVMVLVDGEQSAIKEAILQVDDTRVGKVQNAHWSPTLGKTVALCYMDADVAWPGIEMTINGSRALSIGAPAFLTKSVLNSFSSGR